MKVTVSAGGHKVTDWADLSTLAVEAERLGADSLWTAETWAHDGATPLAYLAAKTSTLKLVSSVLQVGSRSPALLAMTAMTLHSMSGGRFILGLGTSGPQVMEGWHGVPFDRPVQRTREVVEICRRVFAGEPLRYDGQLYQLPLDAAHGGSGEGKVLSSDAPPTPELPIYLAALGPRNLRLTGELADGWIGTSFLPESAQVFLDPIRAGAQAAGRSLRDVDIMVGGQVWFTDDVELAAYELKLHAAFVLGGMGSSRHNFYHAAYCRQGWADDVQEVRRLWLAGDRDEAIERVPLELVLATNLVGSPTDVRERLRRYRDAGVTTFRASLRGQTVADRLDTLGQLLDLIREVDLPRRS
ncbi:LLM class F420-dependent oxidoreductase [Natronosporangium hydrolyticum]|uniref:LLM class F420-dependent oxidoreductase n=1 Tax=Natronosporangium hydrolyticum TaxID=2811111 RepID=A0A895YNN3_9ACTN|nr:LLM class F420-dependent oxidoreductase [Natronosporangium hydrolyticum]QSB16316.1 LLM class F420-dependent oxidoreductase [Natronosporangium hydrolyticum]